MTRWKNPWAHTSDIDYIIAVRQQIKWLDRYRIWAILLNVGLLIATFYVVTLALKLLHALLGNGNIGNMGWPLTGFLTGIILGFGVGGFIHKALHGIIMALGNYRSERLMLKYFDACNEESCDQFEDPDESGSEELAIQ